MVLEPWVTVAVEDAFEDVVPVDFNLGLRLAKLITQSFAIPGDAREAVAGIGWEGWVRVIGVIDS